MVSTTRSRSSRFAEPAAPMLRVEKWWRQRNPIMRAGRAAAANCSADCASPDGGASFASLMEQVADAVKFSRPYSIGGNYRKISQTAKYLCARRPDIVQHIPTKIVTSDANIRC